MRRPPGRTKHKFGAKPQRTIEGYFASTGEMNRWHELQLLERAGEITNLRRQVVIPLYTAGPDFALAPIMIGKRQATYVADFEYFNKLGARVVEDFKGYDTAIGKFKRAIIRASYGFDVQLSTKRGRR